MLGMMGDNEPHGIIWVVGNVVGVIAIAALIMFVVVSVASKHEAPLRITVECPQIK